MTLFDSDLTLIIIIISFVILIIALIVNKESDNRETLELSKWIEEKKEFLDIQKSLQKALKEAGKSTPPCNKCGYVNMQLWLRETDSIKIRCVNCKKVQKIKIGITTENFDQVLFCLEFLVGNLYNSNNSKIREYLNDFLEYDFASLRANQPLYRAIDFEANKEFIVELKSSSDNSKLSYSRAISQNVKDKVWKRDEGKCVQCGSKEKLEFDHIIPYSKGGSNTYRNIQLLCEPCNRGKADKIGY